MPQQLQIETPCPQCGGPVHIDETDTIISCPFCRVKTILIPNPHYRYYIPPADGINEQVYYVPYWRFKGLHFWITDQDIHHKMLDTTILAHPIKHLPFSLGIRTQVLKVKSVPRDMGDRLLSIKTSISELWEKMRGRAGMSQSLKSMQINPRPKADVPFLKEQHFADHPYSNYSPNPIDDYLLKMMGYSPQKEDIQTNVSTPKIYFQEFIGEIISLIYFPIYLSEGKLFDGVLKKPIKEDLVSESIFHQEKPRKNKISFTTHSLLCPHCGWDLDGKRDGLAFVCTQCNKGWIIDKSRLKPCGVQIMQGEKHSIHLPFWKIQADVPFLQCIKYPHQNKIRYRSDPALTKNILVFLIPGFKVVPMQFIKILNRLQFQTDVFAPTETFKDYTFYPANLSMREAIEAIPILISEQSDSKHNLFKEVEKLRIMPKKALLVYLPFEKQGIELIQPETQFSFYHTALRGRTKLEDV